jgi:hypothetical protein
MKEFFQARFKYILYILLSLLFSWKAKSADLYEQGPSARSIGMGGTYMSFVRGAEALYFNPAALARVDGFDFQLAEVQAAYSKDAMRLVDQYKNSGSSMTAADVSSLYGTNSFADVTARSGFVMPYFGVGVYSSNYVLESFNNPPLPTFNTNFISDYGYIIAAAFPINDKTSLGLSFRHIKRWGGAKDILVTDLVGSDDKAVFEKNFQDKGTGHAIDASFLTTLPLPYNPTISIVWQDIGRTTFSQTAGAAAPPSQQDNLTIAGSVQHELFLIDWTHAIEYKHITDSNEVFSKKIHVGTEASFGLFDIRAGLNQGYLTYGGGINLWLLRADVAYYTAELGKVAGQIRNDRVIYSVTLELNFDQSFKLQDSEGKKRRLHQRR